MKKILVLVLLLMATIGYSQNLFTETYSTLCADTAAVSGSTDAGSDWFKNKSYDKVYLEISNGTKYFQFEIATANLKQFEKFKVEMEGSDTTITIEGYTMDGTAPDVSVVLPCYTTSNTYSYKLDFGGDGPTLGAVTTKFIVRFKGLYKKNY